MRVYHPRPVTSKRCGRLFSWGATVDENISEERWDMTGNPASVASAVLQLAAAHQPFNVLKGAPYNCVDADASVTGGQFGIPSKGWWECESLPNGSQLRLWSEAQFWPILAEYRQTFIVQLVKLGLTSAGAMQPQNGTGDVTKYSQPAQPSVGIGNADLAELNRRLPITAMKSGFGSNHSYDPQRLLYILNRCLSPAWEACVFDGENWMSKGQKYIMMQSPGVNESDLSRYLRTARKNGLLEWRGVELPGRPLPG